MRPVLFTLGGIKFYSYGLMVGLGFVLGAKVAGWMAARKGFDPDSLLDFFLLLFVAGTLSGRLFHVVVNPEFYPDFRSFFSVGDGGFSIHGVLMGGIVAAYIYCRVKKVQAGVLFDVIAPGVALGQSVGRLGCLFNGCCYGRLTGSSWGVLTRYAPGLRHPYPIYESIADFILFLVLLKMSERVKFPGGLFLTYLAGYSAIRFGLEFFRDNLDLVSGFSYAQLFSLVMLVLSVGAFVFLKRKSGVEKRVPF